MTVDARIRVVMDESGVVFEYEITAPNEAALAAKAREHCSAIALRGYRGQNQNTYTHFPPHKIAKVQAVGVTIPTSYQDTTTGT